MRQLIYFHGVPGSPAELELFGQKPCFPDAALFAPDRNDVSSDSAMPDYLDGLVSEICDRYPSGPVSLIGFSLGAFVLLRIAHRLEGRVDRIDLIAPAAPLDGQNFLPSMAGGNLFRLAQTRPRIFGTLVRAQVALAKFAPKRLFKVLFSDVRGLDAALSADPEFSTRIQSMMAEVLSGDAAGYRRDILAYVQPWSEILTEISAPVHLWHGTEDNWAPFAMSEYLQEMLPNAQGITKFEGASHYSALRRFFEESAMIAKA